MSRRRRSSLVLPVALLGACVGLVWLVYQQIDSRPHALAESGEDG